MDEKIIAYIDGGSRGNPGPAACAFVLNDLRYNQLRACAFFIGDTTNNTAEYTALLKALDEAKSLGARQIDVYSDSELLVKQLNGQYKVKSDQIRPLYAMALETLSEFKSWQVRHIPREKNKQADALVNRALDLERDIEETPKSVKKTKPIRLGVLISGGGTTLINIVGWINRGTLNAEVVVVISSRSSVAGVEKASAAGLNVIIIRTKDHPDIDDFSKSIEQELMAVNVDLVVQGGWLCLWKIPPCYENKVMNIHPALLPSFGGKGMWGHHVHEAVLKAGCKVSGCTVHFCNNEYDSGPIIVQRCCPVKDDDTAETLAARVFEQECIAYPEAIRLFAEGRLTVKEGKVKINPAPRP
ncbi:MAG: phosphoribosylglycinamide formyltransferase [Sedimentisphaerales bacterium]|nr:phosphoribosylglycinamide formyltransferase [Sedimentisphaerales bacterium]